jgi:RNA polymerase sigma factor (sigma-70 family)
MRPRLSGWCRVIPADTKPSTDEFETFYRREFAQQVRRASLIIGSVDRAADVVHDAFVGVYQRWGQLDDAGSYLNRSVLNGCRDVHRRNSSRDRLFARLVDDGRGGAVDAADTAIVDVLAALPFNQRAAVVLRYYAGFTIAEIATQLGCPQGSVGPWIDRALTTMRKALA